MALVHGSAWVERLFPSNPPWGGPGPGTLQAFRLRNVWVISSWDRIHPFFPRVNLSLWSKRSWRSLLLGVCFFYGIGRFGIPFVLNDLRKNGHRMIGSSQRKSRGCVVWSTVPRRWDSWMVPAGGTTMGSTVKP